MSRMNASTRLLRRPSGERCELTLSPAGRGRGQGEGANEGARGPTHLTLPLRGPLPLPPEGL